LSRLPTGASPTRSRATRRVLEGLGFALKLAQALSKGPAALAPLYRERVEELKGAKDAERVRAALGRLTEEPLPALERSWRQSTAGLK
jgi:hypothetical protein